MMKKKKRDHASYFVYLTGVGCDVVLRLYKRPSVVTEQCTDELTEREYVTGRCCGCEFQLDVWSEVVEVWLRHLGLFRRPRHTTATLHTETFGPLQRGSPKFLLAGSQCIIGLYIH